MEVRGLVNLNVHFHLLVRDGVFVDDDDRLAFALPLAPTWWPSSIGSYVGSPTRRVAHVEARRELDRRLRNRRGDHDRDGKVTALDTSAFITVKPDHSAYHRR